jgi:hypothetical protein
MNHNLQLSFALRPYQTSSADPWDLWVWSRNSPDSNEPHESFGFGWGWSAVATSFHDYCRMLGTNESTSCRRISGRLWTIYTRSFPETGQESWTRFVARDLAFQLNPALTRGERKSTARADHPALFPDPIHTSADHRVVRDSISRPFSPLLLYRMTSIAFTAYEVQVFKLTGCRRTTSGFVEFVCPS